MKKIVYITLLLGALTLSACHDVPVVELNEDQSKALKENMITANRYMVVGEDTKIEAYIERHSWKMECLTGGTRVMETSNTGGEAVVAKDSALVSYTMETLAGRSVYGLRSQRIMVGKGEPLRGIDDALQHLHYGSTARLILPSDQAYGLPGDGGAIGHREILVVEIKEIKKIEK